VLDLMVTPPGALSRVKRVGLMKLALGRGATASEVWSFTEAYEVTNAWINSSNAQRARRMQELGIDPEDPEIL